MFSSLYFYIILTNDNSPPFTIVPCYDEYELVARKDCEVIGI